MATVQNGRLPGALLAPIPWAPTERVTHAVLADLIAMDAAFYAVFDRHLVINEGYRDYATQVDYKARTRLPRSDPRWLGSAATPGTSVHGWGEAIDFGKVMGFDSPVYAWLEENAGRFGFHQPAQYREGGRHPEFWHWEHPSDTPVTQHAAPAAEEDDMYTDADRARALAIETKVNRQDLLYTLFETVDGRLGVASAKAPVWMLEDQAGDRERFINGLILRGLHVRWTDTRGRVQGTVLHWHEHLANTGRTPADPKRPDVVNDPRAAFGSQIPWAPLT